MKRLKMRTLFSMVLVLKYFVVTTLVVTNRAVFLYTSKKIFLSNEEKTLKSYKKQLSPKYRSVVKKVFVVAVYHSPNRNFKTSFKIILIKLKT